MNAAAGSSVPLDEVTKRKVVTEGGADVGNVASLEFDERSFRVTQVEVSPGFFKSNHHVPADQVVRIGPDVVVVADAVVPTADTGAGAVPASG